MIGRRRIIKFQTRKVTVVRTAAEAIQLRCEVCDATVEMVTPECAAEMLMINTRAIYRQVEKGQVHFVEAGAGELLICCKSLRAQASLGRNHHRQQFAQAVAKQKYANKKLRRQKCQE